MAPPSVAVVGAARPTRLSFWMRFWLSVLVLLTFVSGIILWLVPVGEDSNPLLNLHFWRVLHGLLNPVICLLYGYLLCQHMKVGWKMRANHRSGLGLAVILGILILTGAGLYYSGAEMLQRTLLWFHRATGALLPALFLLHWFRSWRWAKKLAK